MASDVQVIANRLNAQKSTGPRTPEGKAVVAQNAVKHGLLARRDIIAGEDPAEFERWREQWLTDLQPVGQAEITLAERIVSLSWRLRRAQWLQNEAVDCLLIRELSGPQANPDGAVGRMIVDDFSGNRALDRLHVCEQRIEGSLYRTMSLLDKRQAQRRRAGEATADEAGPVCSVPARASGDRVEGVPPSNRGQDARDTTPYGVTTNGIDCAKQSQLAESEQGAGIEQPASGLCETKPICPAGQAVGSAELGNAKQSQSSTVDTGHSSPFTTAGLEAMTDFVKQTQSDEP